MSVETQLAERREADARVLTRLEDELLAEGQRRLQADPELDPGELARDLLDSDDGAAYAGLVELAAAGKLDKPAPVPPGLARLRALLKLAVLSSPHAQVLKAAGGSALELRRIAAQAEENMQRALLPDATEAGVLEAQRRDPMLKSAEGAAAYSRFLAARGPATVARVVYADALLDAELEPVAELLALDGAAVPMAKAAEIVPGYAVLGQTLTDMARAGLPVEALEKGHADRARRVEALASRVRGRVRKDAGLVSVEAMLREEVAPAAA